MSFVRSEKSHGSAFFFARYAVLANGNIVHRHSNIFNRNIHFAHRSLSSLDWPIENGLVELDFWFCFAIRISSFGSFTISGNRFACFESLKSIISTKSFESNRIWQRINDACILQTNSQMNSQWDVDSFFMQWFNRILVICFVIFSYHIELWIIHDNFRNLTTYSCYTFIIVLLIKILLWFDWNFKFFSHTN